MKRITVSLLLLSLCLTLCACGESHQDSAASVPDRALPVAEAPAPAPDPSEFYGEWVDLLRYRYAYQYDEKFTFDASNYGDLWKLSDDGKTILIYDNEYSIEESDGVPALICRVTQNDEYEFSHWLVRAEDYETCFDRYFVAVDLSAENVSDYLGPPVAIGDYFDEWGDVAGPLYLYSSPAYSQGLVYLGIAGDPEFLVEEITDREARNQNFPYGMTTGPLWYSHSGYGRARGTIIYAKAEFVQDNSMYIGEKHEAGYQLCERVVTLSNGCKLYDSYVGNWANTNANYDDWKY